MTQLNSNPQPQIGGAKLVIVALVLALLAVIANYVYIGKLAEKEKRESIDAYTLNRNVSAGQIFSLNDVRKMSVPFAFKQAMLGIHFASSDDVERYTHEARKYPYDAPSEALLTTTLMDNVGVTNPKIHPPVGRAWYALPVSPQAVPPMLTKDHSVDIYAFFNRNGPRPENILVMERVKIVQVGSYSVEDSRSHTGSFNTITIDVTPEEAMQLMAIRQVIIGPVEIIIRNPGEKPNQLIRGGVNDEVINLVFPKGRGPVRVNPVIP